VLGTNFSGLRRSVTSCNGLASLSCAPSVRRHRRREASRPPGATVAPSPRAERGVPGSRRGGCLRRPRPHSLIPKSASRGLVLLTIGSLNGETALYVAATMPDALRPTLRLKRCLSLCLIQRFLPLVRHGLWADERRRGLVPRVGLDECRRAGDLLARLSCNTHCARLAGHASPRTCDMYVTS
jgi:hypothetical protein